MDLEKLIESHFAPKKGNDLLIKLIESKLNEAEDRIYTSSPINIEVGKSGTAAYQEFQNLLSGIRSTPFLCERLRMVNDVLLNPPKVIKSASIKKAFSSFFFIQELKDAIENVEKTVAGFQAESIAAQLIDGTKIADNKASDVSSKIFGEFQIKTISDNKVTGSFDLALKLYRKLLEEHRIYTFIIIYKAGNSVYDFYIFGMPFVDFMENIELPENFANEIKIRIPDKEKLESLKIDRDYYNIIEEDGTYYYFMPALNLNTKVKSTEVMAQIDKRQLDVAKTKKFIKNFSRPLQLPISDIPTIGTQFKMKEEFVNSIYKEKANYPNYEKIPTNSRYAGTLNLAESEIDKAKEAYKDKLVGDMLEVIKELNTSVKTMNEYFSTLDRQAGNKTVASLNLTQTTLTDRFLSRNV